QSEIKPESKRVRVLVRGTGSHAMTPTRIDGVSVEVVVESAAGVEPPSWWPGPGPAGEALLDVRDADLTLVGVRLSRGPSGSQAALVRVEDGRLHLAGCWLSAPMVAEPAGGPLLRFRAERTGPLSIDPA